MISEIYGKRKTRGVLRIGSFHPDPWNRHLAGWADATSWSPVSNAEFDHAFGQTALAVGVSMAAYLLAQFIDVRIFHFGNP